MVLIKHLQQICGQLSKQSNYYFSCLCILSSHFSIGNSYDNRFLPVGQFQLLWSLIWSGSSYLFFLYLKIFNFFGVSSQSLQPPRPNQLKWSFRFLGIYVYWKVCISFSRNYMPDLLGVPTCSFCHGQLSDQLVLYANDRISSSNSVQSAGRPLTNKELWWPNSKFPISIGWQADRVSKLM